MRIADRDLARVALCIKPILEAIARTGRRPGVYDAKTAISIQRRAGYDIAELQAERSLLRVLEKAGFPK